MTTLEEQFRNNPGFNEWQKGQRRGQVCAGVIIILAGLVYLYKLLGYFIPDWIFTWPMILIAGGLVSGIKHGFKNPQWLILVLVGLMFLAGNIFPQLAWVHYKIPIVLFIVGTILIFKPRNKHLQYSKFGHHQNRFSHFAGASKENTGNGSDDYIFANNIFAGTDKIIFSKDFKGGEIKNTFGGCKLNLMQAEIVTEAVLTIKQQFGGVKLIIPANWIIKSDIDCVFAGIEDKRPLMNVNDTTQTKTLVLTGHIFMSGIEIVSY